MGCPRVLDESDNRKSRLGCFFRHAVSPAIKGRKSSKGIYNLRRTALAGRCALLSGGTKTGWISFMLSQAFVLCAWLWACVQRWGEHRGGLEDIVEGRQVEVEHHDVLVDLVLGSGGRGGTPLDLAPRSMHPLGVLRQRGEGRRRRHGKAAGRQRQASRRAGLMAGRRAGWRPTCMVVSRKLMAAGPDGLLASGAG